MKANFNLVFGNKNVMISLNDAENAKWVTIDDNGTPEGQPRKCRIFAAALTALMTCKFAIIENSLYLRHSMEELEQMLPEKNQGYAYGYALKNLGYDDVKENAIYRMNWNGVRLEAVELNYATPSEQAGQYAWDNQKHDLAARNQIETLEVLSRCQDRGVNVRVLYTSWDNQVFAELETNWNLFNAGETKELHQAVAKKNTEIQTAVAMKHYEALSVRAAAKNTPFAADEGYTVKDFDGNPVSADELVGRIIQFVAGQVVLPRQTPVTAENVNSIVQVCKTQGRRVMFMNMASGVNAPSLVQ